MKINEMSESLLARASGKKSWQVFRDAGWLVRHKPREAWLILRLSFWVIVVASLMPRCPLLRLLAWLSPRPRKATYQPRLAPQRAAYWLDRLLNLNAWVFTPICWKRALVLHRILGREGIETRILFGVRQPDGQAVNPLNGHAWLECEGRPLLEKEAPQYVVTFAFPR